MRNEFLATSDCICSGQNFTYECSVTGGLFTVWSGSVISQGCEITLLHAQFDSSTGICNNGAVVGQAVREENNCYTSQLVIQVTPGPE